jgi:competence protein ComEC
VWRAATTVSLALSFVLGILMIFHPFSAPGPTGQLSVDFLDVGQGDSALVTFPNGETMLVDGGGRVNYSNDREDAFEPDVPRIGESVVSEFLWEKGYSRIDHLVVTHADADHIQGLIDVARNFEIGNVIVGAMPADDPDLDELLTVVDRKSIPIMIVARGDRFEIGGADVRILHPVVGEEFAGSANDASVVMRIVYGSHEFLLTGDIERAAESDLVDSQPEALGSRVVKVPHHGSRTSSTTKFVEMVRPGLAIISVGRRSRFGHPHPEVVERWSNAGARVMTTGEKGTISVTTTGDDLEVETFIP